MDYQSQQVWESVYNEQSEILQSQNKKINALETELKGHRIRAQIANSRARHTKEKNKQNGFKPKTHYFVKVLKTVNQKTRRNHLFSPAEKQLLFDIIPFIGFNAMVIHENKTPMTVQDIAELCDWGKTHTINTISSLVEKGILERVKDGRNVYIKVSQEYIKCG